MNPIFFGLLHICESEQTSVNITHRSFEEQISIYCNNAITLAKSLRNQNLDFTLLTNNRYFITQCVPSITEHLKISEIPFKTRVPSGIKFYSAHFKVDAFHYLSTLKAEYVVLCDLDMICINNIPNSFLNVIKNSIPLCYDISNQVIPAYGHNVILEDLKAIHGYDSSGHWIGGEFLSGNPDFFHKLVSQIDILFDNYIKSIPNTHHVGDEAITSAAIEVLRRNGIYIGDAGSIGIVNRYWNAFVHNPQNPFKYFEKSFLLHLPADKKFLSKLAIHDVDNKKFVYLYKKEIQRKNIGKLIRKCRSKVLKILLSNKQGELG